GGRSCIRTLTPTPGQTPGSGGNPYTTSQDATRVPVRPVRLIAEGCSLSRAEVERLITEEKVVSAVRLGGKLSDDFTFTLKR
ncbi:DUF1062 domain-containing protein, partial [Streptomyces flaveolus]